MEDKRFQLFEPAGRVLEAPGTSLRFIKKCFGTSEKGFEQQPVAIEYFVGYAGIEFLNAFFYREVDFRTALPTITENVTNFPYNTTTSP